MIFSTSILVGTAVTLTIVITYITRSKPKSLRIITDAHQAHAILKSLDYRRYKSNSWLIKTFSIVNPFTVADESLLKAFKAKVITSLSYWANEQRYDELRSTVRARVDHRLSLLQTGNGAVPLSKLVKQVALDAFLTGILQVHANEELLTELPDLIIHLWKHRDDQAAQSRLQELFSSNAEHFSQSDLWQQLQAILSKHSAAIAKATENDFNEKIANPLNIIVPGWETMWRLVFYALLELLRRPDLLEELRQEIDAQPTAHCQSVQSLLRETLRLYPPTKNIYRTNIRTDEEVCISVQRIHRNVRVWGADALRFRPERFRGELTDEQSQHYLPFSISCPARHKFAYIFAGAILSQILQRCPKLAIADGHSLPSHTEPLDMMRNSYNELVVLA